MTKAEVSREAIKGVVRYMLADGTRSAYMPEDIEATMTITTINGNSTYSINKYGSYEGSMPSTLDFTVAADTIYSFSGLYYGGYAYYIVNNGDDAYFTTSGSVYNSEQGYLSFPYWYYTSYNNQEFDETGTCSFVWGEGARPTAISTISTNANAKASTDGKFLRNGRVVIVKNGKTYSTTGQLVK